MTRQAQKMMPEGHICVSVLPLKLGSFTISLVLSMLFTGSQAGFADTISPSLRTRTLAAPKDDYLQEISHGHPYRWFDRDMALTVLLKPGAGVPHFKPQFEEILRAAFQEWESKSNSKIHFRYVNEPPADITCQFVETIPKQEPSVAGLTNYQTSPHHMDSASILLRTTSSIAPITDELMRIICLHEIGHALGLVRHSLDPHDVMYPFLSRQTNLSTRDINTIRLLYEFKPPDTVLQLAREPKRDLNYPFGLILLSSEDYDAYTRKVVAQLLKHFARFSPGPILETSVSCFVDSSGNIFNYRIFLSSGNEDFDNKVMDSLISALPLPPVPEKLLKNKWAKAPIAINFRSDGWVVPYVEPDKNQSDWLQTNEEPSVDEMLKDLEKGRNAQKKIIDPKMKPWIIEVTQKALAAWKASSKGKAEVLADIGNDGRITDLLLVQKSGDESFDKSVLDACMAAEPYPAAPNSKPGTTEVNLLFEH